MTHTLHRLGNPNNLHDDYVVLAIPAKGINDDGAHKGLRRFMELAFELEPVNAGDVKTGNIFTHSREEILAGIQDVTAVHAVFTEKGKVVELLKRVREADLGISIVVSGLFDQVGDCANQAGLSQHTTESSLGVWGRVDRLPDADVLQVTTMCGHGLIAPNTVKRVAREVRLGRVTSEGAAIHLARTCVCGVFNPVRAARLLQGIATQSGARELQAHVAIGQTSFE